MFSVQIREHGWLVNDFGKLVEMRPGHVSHRRHMFPSYPFVRPLFRLTYTICVSLRLPCSSPHKKQGWTKSTCYTPCRNSLGNCHTNRLFRSSIPCFANGVGVLMQVVPPTALHCITQNQNLCVVVNSNFPVEEAQGEPIMPSERQR